MKCEKCERELVGETVICSGCGHDSSLRKATLASAGEQARPRSPSINGGEANLIRFPTTTSSSVANDDTDGVPIWRNVVKERVRQFREQRPESATPGFATDDAPTNPIVEAALKRLSRPAEQYAEPRSGGYSSVATASLPHERIDSVTDPVVAARPTRRETAGLLQPNHILTDGPTPRTREAASVRQTSASQDKVAPRTELKSNASLGTSLLPLNPPQPATLWDRTLAGIFDFALIVLACIPLYSIHSITGLKYGQSAAYAVIAIAVWISFIYQMWTMLVAGRTCGMAWRRLRVFDAETRDARFPEWRLFARALCGPVSILLPPLNLAVIWASGSQSGLADLVSRTTLLQTHVPQTPQI